MAYTCQSSNGIVSVVKNEKRQFAVIDAHDNIIVPFGKYEWIDAYDRGLARVRTSGQTTYTNNTVAIFVDHENFNCIEDPEAIKAYTLNERKEHPENFAKWGVINESGEEVLPLEYDEVWNFKNSKYNTIIVEKNDIKSKIKISALLEDCDEDYAYDNSYNCDYSKRYGEYAGSYAQDVMRYDDDTIGDAFDGDPDAYWNID